ncbi:MAG TPA: conjugal transfer protein TrbF [Rhizomicrobium sp.]|nr:conjugal transfer protein TrbF [Rhizomicrobium sp.]
MAFRRTIQRYGDTPEPVTPYQKAAQMWDERIGSARVQAKNWRLAAIGALATSAILACGLVWLSAQSRVVPYVVQTDRLGEVQAVGPAIRNYQPNDAQIAYFLAHFIADVRSLSIDPIVVRKNWLEAYDYATDHGAAFLNDFARQNDPFKSVGERTVAVQVTSVVRVSDSSFQVKWIEETYDHDSLAKTEHWTAILSTVRHEPDSADVLRKNPLGLYVDSINWSRELNPNE